MYLRVFFIVAALVLSVLPVVNMLNQKVELDNIKNLYSTDFVESILNDLLIDQGISTDPEQVIIGKKRWFFLGDRHGKIITNFREGGKQSEIERSNIDIVKAQLAWKVWLESAGVKSYKILIGPNKSTIYSELVPDWAQSSTSISDTLFSNDENDIFVDVRDELKNNKTVFPVYYRTNTHWNYYGAGIAYKKFFNSLKPKEKHLHYPDANWYQVSHTNQVANGDLAAFLKVKSSEINSDPITEAVELPLEHIIYDFHKNEEINRVQKPLFGSVRALYLINTPNALNDKKVLWLSDSFGDALSPYMTASFTNVLKTHWDQLIGTKNLEELVRNWKPDYVFVTAVERNIIHDKLKAYPSIDINHERKAMKNIVELFPPKLHNIKYDNVEYSVTGDDPFLIYNFKNKVSGKEIPALAFNLKCTNSIKNIPIQIFWKSSNTSFNEKDSVKFNVQQGHNQLMIPNWLNSNDMKSIRLDFNEKIDCAKFKMNELKIGRYIL